MLLVTTEGRIGRKPNKIGDETHLGMLQLPWQESVLPPGSSTFLRAQG